MASDEMDEYFVYGARLASFTKPQAVAAKRRVSNASTHSRAPKALSWPHKSIKPADMARAGFVFQPLPSNPDNVACFLCNKALDGWEEDDSPLEEHLKHSPECGWAITAAVEAELGGYAAEDPRDPLMVEARKATFSDMWPHESKKGWTCKTKQLVEAGWKYTPLVEGDDNATCAYCQLALDGWEKSDKPWDEHYSRAPNCPFFSLISSKPAPKRAGRSKAARTSKASRLSLQSVATIPSDMPSLADMSADVDNSVVTTASTMTTASKASKSAKGKKATTSRARKTRAKKDEAVEVHEVEPEQDEKMDPPPPPKATKGRKRASVEVEESDMTNAEAPAPKKRATKTRKARGSSATEVSQADNEMTDDPELTRKSAAKKNTKKTTTSRKAASSRDTRNVPVATSTPSASPPPQIPDDDEIDRQLEADLDRSLEEDDEDMIVDADPETKRAAESRKKRASETQDISQEQLLAHTATTDFAMFDPEPVQPTDEQVEADLQSMKDEMEVDHQEQQPAPEPEQEPEPEPKPELDELKVPKKGRKAGTRKVSKSTTTKKAKEIATSTEQPQPRMTAEAEEPDEIAEADVSFASNGTVVRNMSLGRASLSRVSLGSITSTLGAKPPAKRGRPPKKKLSQDSVEQPAETLAPVEAVVEPAPEAPEVGEEPTPMPAPAPVEATKKRPSTGKRGRPPKKTQTPDANSQDPTSVETSAEPEPEAVQDEVETAEASNQENLSTVSSSPRIPRIPVPAPKDSPFAIQPRSAPAGQDPEPQLLAPPKTPGHQTSPAQSAKQATISPSPSPQASDEENRPPSSKPGTTSSKAKRMPLGELPVATPTRQTSVSPSKQLQKNVIGGLQSTEQWSAVDLDLIFEEFYHDQENVGTGSLMDRFFAKGGELTDHERNMTVEEWVYYNAGQAEEKLKFECESMVMKFESEGTRAMRVLEGLVVE